MKKTLLFLAVFVMMFSYVNAQYSVLLVDDDHNGPRESARIDSALAHSGYTYGTYLIDSVMPAYDTLAAYDMVIWTTANDGADLYLWDVTDSSNFKFNAPLMQYLDSNKVVWLDGLDYMYDIFKQTPTTFATGDIVYDVMGIDTYVAQSHKDDSLGSYNGLTMALKTANNTINTLDTLQWKWSSLWYGDAFDITSDATGLYEMGPADYDFAGKINCLYKENMVTSSLRIGSLGKGGAYDQDAIDKIVKDMIVAAEAGTFTKSTIGIENNEAKAAVKAFPNPANNQITFTFPASNNVNISVFDIAGKKVMNEMIDGSNGSYRMNISELKSGIYFYQITFDNTIATYKFSVVK